VYPARGQPTSGQKSYPKWPSLGDEKHCRCSICGAEVPDLPMPVLHHQMSHVRRRHYARSVPEKLECMAYVGNQKKPQTGFQIVTPCTGCEIVEAEAVQREVGNVDWVPTFGGNMLGWVPTWVLIAVVVSLLSVIVVLVAAVKAQIEDDDQREKNQPPLL
jgi:hypothetical protein